MERELSLDPLAGDNSADREHLARARSVTCNHDAGEDLDALFFAFQNSGVDIDGIADIKFWRIFVEARLLDVIHNLLAHFLLPLSLSLLGPLKAVLFSPRGDRRVIAAE